MKIKLTVFTLTLLLCVNYNVDAQKKQIDKFQAKINDAVKKAYVASVRMWGFDVQQNQRTSAQFSGVVVSADGYILTAAHTIFPGKNYKVFFPDGKECIAIALGRIDNKETPGIPDVGMMKIVDKGIWPFAEMGYSYSLVKNEPCISISYPESLNQSLPTLRLGRIEETKNTYGFIRSSCKMEPGDSGGPLFDYMGRVIGLHSAIDLLEDQNFEIPVDLYRKYWTALNLENNYSSFPEIKDSIGLDPLQKIIQKDNKMKFLNPDFSKISSILNVSYLIESNLKGSIANIGATLFNFQASNGEVRQFLISKNTMIGSDPQVTINGVKKHLNVIAKDQDNDLMLLQTEVKIKGGVNLKPGMGNEQKTEMGRFLYTVKPDGRLIHSILSSSVFSLPKVNSQAYLGAMVAYNSSPVYFSLIKPESPAGKAGIKVGDELVSINGKNLTKASEFAPTILQFWVDDEVNFEWISDGVKKSKIIPLTERTQSIFNHPAEKFEGGKSVRRDGFDQVFAQDAAIKPAECGTPIFDLEGNFCGINIARFSRTATICIPTKVVIDFVVKSLRTE
ncbi:trypsin-like peptidase domain-containing protein [Pedobacter fastidiosus]|uniref:Trypsin-like peptidase domain-containing protein n=1 Tax=Pedobacter fastidiosus TaxID=2765361 RepID=A0ABR7KUW1_9SPHI|nr:trypsin-like peptidase domain-containing protein [Pedobacter fastidiosus]MBC6111888.1 trypsin-like peptidase domain-containing protein [Pedobacter fastidiosus]